MTDAEATWIAFTVVGSVIGAIIWYAADEQVCPREQRGHNCRAGSRLPCECEVKEWL